MKHPSFLKPLPVGKKFTLFEFDRAYRGRVAIDSTHGPYVRIGFGGTCAFADSVTCQSFGLKETREKIRKIIPLVEEVNSHIRPEWRTRFLVFYDYDWAFPELRMSMYYSNRFNCIYGFKEALAHPEYAGPSVFHELSHSAYYYVISERSTDRLGELHAKLLSLATKPHSKCGLIRALCESDCPAISRFTSDFGHVQDNRGELFASTSTKLRFFPKEFFEKAEGMESADERKLLASIAREVALAWGKARVFSEEVYCRLGI